MMLHLLKRQLKLFSNLTYLEQNKFLFSTLKSPCLVRDFIQDRLYHPQQGYFCKDDIQIGELKQQIDFKNLIGFEEYQRKLIENYPKNAWLTPCEIFKPYYGMAIANYMHQLSEFLQVKQVLKKKNHIKILEVGAGSGTAAQSILTFFKNFEQQYYQHIEYNIIELSPQMCKRALNKLSIEHKKLIDRGQIRVFHESIADFKPVNKEDYYFIIFLEVLDNMPHDRVYFDESKKDWLQQAMVEIIETNNNSSKPNDEKTVQQLKQEMYKELKVPISDTLIREVLDIYKQLTKDVGGNLDDAEDSTDFNLKKSLVQQLLKWYYKQDTKNIFLPTYCYKVLKHLNRHIPNNHVLIADFDMLRNAQSALQGINAPVVSKKLSMSHEKQDYKDYLVPRGEADIFFPTNFKLLQKMYKKACGKDSRIFKTHEFMSEFSREKWTETKSGYNPLKEDFQNTSFLCTHERL